MTQCEHEWEPGEPAKDTRFWERFALEARCSKCGAVDPDRQFMPPEVWARRQERKQYPSDEAFERHLIEEVKRSGPLVGLPVTPTE